MLSFRGGVMIREAVCLLVTLRAQALEILQVICPLGERYDVVDLETWSFFPANFAGALLPEFYLSPLLPVRWVGGPINMDYRDNSRSPWTLAEKVETVSLRHL